MYEPKPQLLLRGVRDGFFKGPQTPKTTTNMFYERASVVGWLLTWGVIFVVVVWLSRRGDWLPDLFG